MISIDIFPWNENFNTNIAQIDEQHKKLVELLNTLANYVAFQADIAQLNSIFDELADYVRYHFETEEKIWQGYLNQDALARNHKDTHESFAETIQQLKAGITYKLQPSIIEELLAFLTRWLAVHILESDRYLAMVVLALQSNVSLSEAKQHAKNQMGGSTRVLIDIILSMYDNLSVNTLHLMRELSERKRCEDNRHVERELIKRQMEKSISLLSATLESVNDAILVVDTEGYWELYNQQFVDLWQIPNNILNNKEDKAALAYALSQLENPDEFLNKVKELYAQPQSNSFDVLKFKNGKIIERYSIPQRINNKVVGRVWSFRDVTEREQAKIALHNLNQHSYLLLNSIEEGAYGVDIKGYCQFVNQSFLRILGYDSVDEIIGKHVHELIHHSHPDGSAYLVEECKIYSAFVRNEKSHVSDEVFWRKDGTAIPVEYWSQPVVINGVVTGAIATFIDITERKQAEHALRQESEKNLILLRNASDGIHILDTQGNIVEVSDTFCAMLGYEREQMLGMNVAQWDAEHNEVQVMQLVKQQFEKKGRSQFETRHKRKDGSILDVEVSGLPIQLDGKSLLFNSSRDISERKRLEQQLRIAATVFESQEGMMVVDMTGNILSVNQSFSHITGYSPNEVLGKNPRVLKSGKHARDFYCAMWSSINNTGTWQGELWNKRKNGELYPQYLSITAVKNHHGFVSHYVGTLTDISSKKAAAQEIERLAFYDPLTALPNRRLLQERLKSALILSQRNGHHGALLFIDLDNFKSLNDTLGHDMGDLLLQQVAERLLIQVRESDTVARLGGDEFVIMLEGLSQQTLEAATEADTLANELLALFRQPFLLSSTCHYLSTASIGVTLFNGHQRGCDELLKHADIAMYQAKTAGRNAVQFFDPQMQEIISSRVLLEEQLRLALTTQQFQLHYQIQVNNAQHLIGAEALIRWQHPTRGLLSPIDFIPLAEETGLIRAIGRWVLETACAQLKAWQQNPNMYQLVLSVNVSAKQLFQADFTAHIKTCITNYAVNPALLKLELTESILLKNIEEIIAIMNELKAIGIQFALDDFGTGYSSLQYLKRLPLQQLKIDKSFVRDISIDNSDQVIVCTIIAMATSLGLNVIAEGVETPQQQQFLLANGCHHYQGYLFSEPLALAEFEQLVSRSKIASAIFSSFKK